MKKVKRITAIIMLFAMIMVTISGCGSKPAAQGNVAAENQEGNSTDDKKEEGFG